MPKKQINWGTDEEFIAKYEELKSSRRMEISTFLSVGLYMIQRRNTIKFSVPS